MTAGKFIGGKTTMTDRMQIKLNAQLQARLVSSGNDGATKQQQPRERWWLVAGGWWLVAGGWWLVKTELDLT